MNNLTVFNNEIIPVYTTDTGEKVVIGRELHERLKLQPIIRIGSLGCASMAFQSLKTLAHF